MNHLDKTGLSYLWSKIKNKFAQKNIQTITLLSSGWVVSGDSYSQLVNVSGITINSIIIVSPTSASSNVYGASGVKCVSQTSGTLSFTANSIPESDLSVNILNFGDE